MEQTKEFLKQNPHFAQEIRKKILEVYSK
jgi:hypothetical protein